MADFRRKASKGAPNAPSATTGESSNGDAWDSANPGSYDNSWKPSDDAGPSGFENNAVEDDTPDITAMK